MSKLQRSPSSIHHDSKRNRCQSSVGATRRCREKGKEKRGPLRQSCEQRPELSRTPTGEAASTLRVSPESILASLSEKSANPLLFFGPSSGGRSSCIIARAKVDGEWNVARCPVTVPAPNAATRKCQFNPPTNSTPHDQTHLLPPEPSRQSHLPSRPQVR